MIYLRLDERLLHGQVTTTWISVLGVTHIILADDKVSNDTVHCQLLKMSAPKETRLLITSVEKKKKETIQAHAEARGESVNGFINRAISETMERDSGAPVAAEEG